MTADPKSVLSHGLAPEVGTGGGYPLLDPADVRYGVDRGDGVLGTLVPQPVVAEASSLVAAIVARFEADAWLGDEGNVAGGISYHEAVEKDPDYPHVTFHLGAEFDHHAAGQVEDWKLQFDVFSDKRSSSEVDGILDHLLSCFNGAQLLVEGRTNAIAPAVAMRDAFKDEERKWQGIMVFELSVA